MTLMSFVLVLAAVRAETAKEAAKASSSPKTNVFLEKPYVQLGFSNKGPMLIWQTTESGGNWRVKFESDAMKPGGRTSVICTEKVISGPGIKTFSMWTAGPLSVPAGGKFTYHVFKDQQEVFQASSVAMKGSGGGQRFVVFGDSGVDSDPQKEIAVQTYNQQPDYVVVTGDLVYPAGQIGDYRTKWFPIYNAETVDPKAGAPLMRTVPIIAVPGNHDTDTTGNGLVARDLQAYPDGLAYFLFWQQPLNGPKLEIGAPNTPLLLAGDKEKTAFLSNAAPAYPQMCNFSFDAANAHWTVIDANFYSNWTSSQLRDWLEKDLASASGATWRFVAFHQPGFTSDPIFSTDQRMRVVSDLFEKYKVDIVFNGHVHHYERSYPLKFKIAHPIPTELSKATLVKGEIQMDKKFDGKSNTQPDGVIYLVTGGGGAKLFGADEEKEPEKWQPFTQKYLGKHCITVCEINDKKLTLRQVATDGAELDRMVVTK